MVSEDRKDCPILVEEFSIVAKDIAVILNKLTSQRLGELKKKIDTMEKFKRNI